jgi:CBS domain-containing protein
VDSKDHRSQNPNQITVVAHMMTPGVVQIPGDVSVTEAASLLEREQMPCLLIKDTDTRFGLMTPADIVKKVVAQGLEPDHVEVRAIMSRPVQFIEYDRAVDEASTLMMSTGTPILIVTKQNQPVGVITAKDLVLSPKRRPVNIPAVIDTLDERPPTHHQAVIIQLSHAGAVVESPGRLLPGTTIVLTFTLPQSSNPLAVHATVLNRYDQIPRAGKMPPSSASRVEVQFIQLSPSDQSTIQTWILQNSPPPSQSI